MSRRRRRRERNRAEQRAQEQAKRSIPVRLPSTLQQRWAGLGLDLARARLLERRWRDALAHAENARAVDPEHADALIAEASYRESRREALKGQFASAVRH